jgi:hypothetical protein
MTIDGTELQRVKKVAGVITDIPPIRTRSVSVLPTGTATVEALTSRQLLKLLWLKESRGQNMYQTKEDVHRGKKA